MNFKNLLLPALISAISASAQEPVLSHWVFNSDGNTYNGILTDVESVYYTSTNVYIVASGIPNYYQDGLTMNDGTDMDWVIGIPKNPVQNTGNPSNVGQGQIGIYNDGSVIFHPGDGQSYQQAGVWNRIAYFFEQVDFDASLGHSTPTNTYHHHVINLALSSAVDSSLHSPLVGFAWDGFPVYGPYGYSDPNDASSAVTRMRSGYQERNMSSRTTLPNGTAATGPAIGGMFPLGCFIEDYEFVDGSGTLDSHNGRFCITPEYPQGTYAYFKTIKPDHTPDYPYTIGLTYYGVVLNGNQGPQGGHFTIPQGATQVIPTITSLPEASKDKLLRIDLYPNPVENRLFIQLKEDGIYNVSVADLSGKEILQTVLTGNSVDMQNLSPGIYLVTITDQKSGVKAVSKIVKE